MNFVRCVNPSLVKYGRSTSILKRMKLFRDVPWNEIKLCLGSLFIEVTFTTAYSIFCMVKRLNDYSSDSSFHMIKSVSN